jgi:4-hydroxy-3-polyprenylbenzoate decarboxylase
MRIIVGVSGASGTILAQKMLLALHEIPSVETHLVMSESAVQTMHLELKTQQEEMIALADEYHPIGDIAANIASGSFKTEGMIVIPCSMKTLSGIVSGYSDNLLLRAADVCLKERRKLLLVTREMPLSCLHLENMHKAAQFGAIIMPPMLTFYNTPETINDMLNHLIGKILMQFDLEYNQFSPWCGG